MEGLLSVTSAPNTTHLRGQEYRARLLAGNLCGYWKEFKTNEPFYLTIIARDWLCNQARVIDGSEGIPVLQEFVAANPKHGLASLVYLRKYHFPTMNDWIYWKKNWEEFGDLVTILKNAGLFFLVGMQRCYGSNMLVGLHLNALFLPILCWKFALFGTLKRWTLSGISRFCIEVLFSDVV